MDEVTNGDAPPETQRREERTMETEVKQVETGNDVAVIAKAINEVMKAVGYIKKDKQMQGQGSYKYASEEALLTAIRPAMIEAGLVLIPDVTEPIKQTPHGDKGASIVWLTVDFKLVHTSGAMWPFPIRVPGCGYDSLDKGIAKAMTGATKYALLKILQLATGDDEEKASRMNSAGERAARAAHDDGGLRNGELLGAIEAIGADGAALKAWWDRVVSVVHESERAPYRDAFTTRCAALGIQPGKATKGEVVKAVQRRANGPAPIGQEAH